MFKLYRIFGYEGHRQRAAFMPHIVTQYQTKNAKLVTAILYTAEDLNTHDYVELAVEVEGGTSTECRHAAAAQITDGVLVNCRFGRIYDITDIYNPREVDLWWNY